MIDKFNNKKIIMDNKIKWKNLPGKDKHEIFDMFINEYNKTYNENLEYKFINAKFVDFITSKVYYIDKNGNKYYIYHKNDFGKRIKTPYFKKMYKKRVDREGFDIKENFYGYDEKPPLKIIKLEANENHILYMLKNSQYKRCDVIFENNEIKCMIVMKDGNGRDYRYKRELSKRNKIYNQIKEQALNDYKRRILNEEIN